MLALAAACAPGSGPAVPQPPPVRVDAPAPALPPVPAADGPLRLTVVYPPDSARITAGDSTFIFGATGTGRARLTVNGVPVDVAPNGAWLAFLPVPPDGVYRLQATKDSETVRLERRVIPPLSLAPGRAAILEGSAYPAGAIAVPAGEAIEVGFDGTAAGTAALVLPDGRRIPLLERPGGGTAWTSGADFRPAPDEIAPRGPPVSRYAGTLRATLALAAADTTLATSSLAAIGPAALQPGPRPRPVASFELIVGSDTVRAPLQANLTPLAAPARTGSVRPPAGAPADWSVRARPGLGGPFHWFWPPGALVGIEAERAGQYRVRLTSRLTAWVPAADIALLPESAPQARGTVAGVRLASRADAVVVRIATTARLPFRVDATDGGLEITVYGATSEVNFLQYGSLDPLIDGASWSQPAEDEFRVRIGLTAPPWGHLADFDGTGALVVTIRRPPPIDPARPLTGLLVAVDAGHPPGGATGPTGLTEAAANLAIARDMAVRLEAAGARVLMTRTDAAPIDTGARTRLAAEMSAHLLVSVHNNAFPDGVNPFDNNGTSVYYYQDHSRDLAYAVQSALLEELRLRDIGIGRADLALVRPTWMPAILSETMFLMVPQQEAALRDAAVQRRIAEAHVRGIEAFLRRRAEAARVGSAR